MQISKKKDSAFELYRAVAVSMVFMCHFGNLSKDIPVALKDFFDSFAAYGLAIFFIISGYLLSASFMSLVKKKNRVWAAVKIFFIKRILRIYPAYIVSLIIFTILLTYFFKHPVYWFDLLVHFFNIHNLFEGFNRSINGVYWTLAMEFQWYLFAPVLILLIIKANIKIQISLLLGLLCLSASARFIFADDFFKQIISNAEMIRLGNDQLYVHLYNFMIGIIIFKWRDQKIKIHSSVVWLLLILVLISGYVRIHIVRINFTETMFFYSYLLEYAGIFIIGVLMFVFLNLELHGKFYRIISFISLISYSLYIYHFPVLHYVRNFNFPWYINLSFSLAISIFIAAISYYIIEAPFLKYSSMLGKKINSIKSTRGHFRDGHACAAGQGRVIQRVETPPRKAGQPPGSESLEADW